MGKAWAFATLGLIVASMVVPMAIAVDHIVGGSDGWTSGVDYDAWTAGKSFTVGDTLLFSYDLSHTVDVVAKDGYDNCDVREPIASFQDGNTTVPLTKTGPTYFICATTGHCLGGMKLSLTVQSTALPPETSSPPLPPPLPPSPSPSMAASPFPADGLLPPPPLLAPKTNGGSQKLSNVLGFGFAAMVIKLII